MTSASVDPAAWQPRWQKLVRAIVRVHSERGQEQLLDSLARPSKPRVLAFVNAHAMNSAAVSQDFFSNLMCADLLVRDGSGMAILMKLLNQLPGLNLNGTDLIPRLIRRFAGRSIALFGTEDPWLARAQQAVLTQLAPGTPCVVAHGFLDAPRYLRLAAAHRPALIVLGMGMPRQEEVAAMLREALGYPCLIVCGGAIIDFLGGRTPRAPAWMRGFGLEWAYRLALEPKRLFRRYVLGNPLFVSRALSLAAASSRHDRGAAT